MFKHKRMHIQIEVLSAKAKVDKLTYNVRHKFHKKGLLSVPLQNTYSLSIVNWPNKTRMYPRTARSFSPNTAQGRDMCAVNTLRICLQNRICCHIKGLGFPLKQTAKRRISTKAAANTFTSLKGKLLVACFSHMANGFFCARKTHFATNHKYTNNKCERPPTHKLHMAEIHRSGDGEAFLNEFLCVRARLDSVAVLHCAI